MLTVIIVAIMIIAMDLLWLGVIAKPLYISFLGHLLNLSGNHLQPNWSATVVVYIALTIGILYFSIPKAHNELLPAFCWGALLGFVIYGAYNFTNLAVLMKWPLSISIIDTIWGMFMCGIVTFIAVFLRRYF